MSTVITENGPVTLTQEEAQAAKLLARDLMQTHTAVEIHEADQDQVLAWVDITQALRPVTEDYHSAIGAKAARQARTMAHRAVNAES